MTHGRADEAERVVTGIEAAFVRGPRDYRRRLPRVRFARAHIYAAVRSGAYAISSRTAPVLWSVSR